jgi:sporulation protein YlmC with PRC-barrel domain
VNTVDKTDPSLHETVTSDQIRQGHTTETVIDVGRTQPVHETITTEPVHETIRTEPVHDTLRTPSMMAGSEHADPRVRETARLIASDKVEGTAVRNSAGDKVGTIERVMIDKRSGKVAYAVMTFGGFLGMGQDYVTLPWHVLRYSEDLDAYELNVTADQLRGAPRFGGTWDNDISRDWERDIHSYYGVDPYW